jgi:hypothetical protein
MKRAEIWFHMKKVPICEDICTRLLYFDIVCWPDTTGNSNCEMPLAWFSGVGFCPKSKCKKTLMWNPLMIGRAVDRQSKDLWFESQSRQLEFSVFHIYIHTIMLSSVLSGLRYFWLGIKLLISTAAFRCMSTEPEALVSRFLWIVSPA